jgi:hypothetical protein
MASERAVPQPWSLTVAGDRLRWYRRLSSIEMILVPLKLPQSPEAYLR